MYRRNRRPNDVLPICGTVWLHDADRLSMTTNICFGGAGLRTAYLTLSGTGRIVSMQWPRPGLKLNY
jgi:hypothetical protein